MKKIFYIAIMSLGLMSCSDFLDEKLQSNYSSNNIYSNAQQVELVLTGVYNGAAYSTSLWKFGDVASDDALKGGSDGDQTELVGIDDFSAKSDNGVILEFWQNTYETISRTNNLITGAVSTNMDTDTKNRYIAEAKFIRAYSYFQLVNIFGKVPLKLFPQDSEKNIHVGLSEVSAVYAQIEKDLTEAYSVLPVKANSLGHATKGSAYGLLAKAQLYQKKYDEALGNIRLLEQLEQYGLDSYANLFKLGNDKSKEVIFALQFKSFETPACGNSLNQWFAPSSENGYYFDTPTQSYVDCFNEKQVDGSDDLRLDLSIGRDGKEWLNGNVFSASWSPTGYLVKKHNQPLSEVPAGIKGDGGLAYIYLRYADILLIKAECLNEKSNSEPALAETELNYVRSRAGLAKVSGNNQATVREMIRTERRRELGFEFHRFFDLMRWGKEAATSVLGDKFKWVEPRFYFPIPQGESDSNSGIKK